MQIIVVLLLAVALALLVLGLIGSSPALVVASILASVVAVVAIARVRQRRAESASAAPQRPAPAAEPSEPSMAELVAAVSASKHAAGSAGQDAVTVGELTAEEPARSEPAPPVAADQGQPAESTDDEDDPPAADTQAPLADHSQNLVWVIDGRPRYHLVSCDFLTGRPGEPVPLSQAVEDGFSPCARCDPDNRIGQSPAG